MNTRQLQYALALFESLNFSSVAERLGITQPALSKQILNLENELGVKLFDRNTVPLSVTPAGEHFFREAQKLLYKEDQLLRSMEEFKSGKRGRLVIGISPFRSLYMIPDVVRQVRERYPDVEVVLCEPASDQLRRDAAEGKYDFAVVNLPVDEAVLDVTPLEQDKLVLVVPKNLWDKVPATGSLTMSQCKNLPFVVVSRGQELREVFEGLCAGAQIHPPIAMEVVGVTTAWAMAQAGIGAALVPLQFVEGEQFGENVRILTLKDNTFVRQPAIVTRRGQHLSRYDRAAIDLLIK